MPGSTVLLSAILDQIGASEFLQAFINEGDDDLCIAGYRKAERVKRDFGLPLDLASKFVDMCRAVNIIQRVVILDVGSSRPTVLLSAILADVSASEYLQAFIKDGEDDLCIAGYRKAERISRDFNLPMQLATPFVNMCVAVHLIKSNHVAMSQISSPGGGGVVIQPVRANSFGETSGASAGGAGVRVHGNIQQQPSPISGYIQHHPSEQPPPTSHHQQANFGTSQLPVQQPPQLEANDASSLTAKVAALSEKAKIRWKQVFNRGAGGRKPMQRSSQDDPTFAHAASAPRGSRFVPGMSDMQVALHTNVGALPPSCSTYTVQTEMTNTEFIVLTQQLMVVSPHDSISVACCHRLPPKIRQHVRLGSTIASLSLLDYKSQLVQVITSYIIITLIHPLHAHSASYDFSSGMGHVPQLNLPQVDTCPVRVAFSQDSVLLHCCSSASSVYPTRRLFRDLHETQLHGTIHNLDYA